MTDAQVKHAMFQLSVQENGVQSWAGAPETLPTFLLLIAEAVTNGFWTHMPTTTSAVDVV